MARNNHPPRIAMIGQKRVPSREGGVEIVVWELANRMRDAGYEVTCYNRSGYHMTAADYERIPGKKGLYKDGIRIITVPSPKRSGLNAFVYSLLATIHALFCGYDVIHYHAEGPCMMIWLPHLFGIRTVATIHGLDWQRAKWGHFASTMLKLGEKTAARYADEVIVLSRSVQNYFQQQYGRQTDYITNGITPPSYRTPGMITKDLGLIGNDYILTLSRIVPEKGLHYLIEAFKDLKTDKKLVIAGSAGSTREYMQKIEEMAAQDSRILLAGFVEGQLMEELLSNAWIYAIPSDVEGMSISLLEAMSYGNCCLVSDIDENLEVVEDKAVSFKKSDVADLKNKLEDLLQHPETVEHYRHEASEFILHKYNWDKVAAETMKLFKK